jgi:hypothetical protein
VNLHAIVPKFSPGKIWSLVRRDVKRGLVASYHDYNTLARIDEWTWPYWGEKAHTVPVHVLTGAQDWRHAAWMLASFFHATEIAWPILFHDDGTLSDEGRQTLQRIFPDARIISRAGSGHGARSQTESLSILRRISSHAPARAQSLRHAAFHHLRTLPRHR